MKFLTLSALAFFLCACTPTWWPFEAKVAEDVLEDADKELKCEAPPLPQVSQTPTLQPSFLPPINLSPK